jgi:tRNA/rRNA methyltransferase
LDRTRNLNATLTAASPLAVVLVGPEQPANVGFAARMLACYGLADFRIVGSPGMAVAEPARKTAKGASQVLESARYFETLPAAIADCGFAFGFTRRTREPAQKIMDLGDAVPLWNGISGQGNLPVTALVFGRESQGLFREETLALSHLVRIPMPDEILSLNLSHAVAIALYAFLGAGMGADVGASAGADSDVGEEVKAIPPPERARDAAALESLLMLLEARGFFRGGKESAQKDYTRILWQRLQPNRQELDFLAGMLKRLAPGT